MKKGQSFTADLAAYLETSDFIPNYKNHIAKDIIALGDDMLLSVIELKGEPFNTVMNKSLESKSDHLTRFFNELVKINAPNIQFKTHMIKSKVNVDLGMSFDNWFSEKLAEKYLKQFNGDKGGNFYNVSYFLSITLKYNRGLSQGIETMDNILGFARRALASNSPKILAVKQEGNAYLSEIGQFLSQLVNYNDPKENYVFVGSSKIASTIQTAKVYFGSDLAEIRNEKGAKYATFYDLLEFPSESWRGMWNQLLDVNSEFVLTQTFKPYTINASANGIESQINKLTSSSRPPEHYIAELESVKSLVSTGEVVFGDYHAVLTVLGDTPEMAVDNGSDLRSLLLSSSSANFLKATNTGYKSFYSHLPNNQYTPFTEPKTTRNLVNGWSLNNYPSGKARGNPIGDGGALMPLKTPADTIYYFNAHYSKDGVNNLGKKMLGHTLLLGQSGAGKTTFEGVLANFIGRFNGKFFAIDFNRSMQLFFEALGGHYFDISMGEPTGLQPFQLPDSANTRAFLYTLVAACGKKNNGEPVTALEESKIKEAVDTIMGMEPELRRFGMISTMIPPEGDDGLGDRLSKWQHSCNGTYAWALDCDKHLFNPYELNRVGFNSTDILTGGGTVVTEPILSVLFHIKDMMQEDGELMTSFIEEFWVPANYPTTQEKIKGSLKAGRIKNEFMFLASQSPADAINCAIFEAIIEQTATKIFLPNDKASWEQYKKCGLNKKEFDELMKKDALSREFLVSQGSHSGFCKLDLNGFDEFLPVLSPTWEGIAIAKKYQAINPDSNYWIREFVQEIFDSMPIDKRPDFDKENFKIM